VAWRSQLGSGVWIPGGRGRCGPTSETRRVGFSGFSTDCATGGAPCSPLWLGDGRQGDSSTGDWSTVRRRLRKERYAVTSHDASLYAFAVGCGTGGAECTPLWSVFTANYDNSPTLADGVIYVAAVQGEPPGI